MVAQKHLDVCRVCLLYGMCGIATSKYTFLCSLKMLKEISEVAVHQGQKKQKFTWQRWHLAQIDNWLRNQIPGTSHSVNFILFFRNVLTDFFNYYFHFFKLGLVDFGVHRNVTAHCFDYTKSAKIPLQLATVTQHPCLHGGAADT